MALSRVTSATACHNGARSTRSRRDSRRPPAATDEIDEEVVDLEDVVEFAAVRQPAILVEALEQVLNVEVVVAGEDVSTEVVEDVVIGRGAGRAPRLETFEETAVVEGLEALLGLAELSEVQSSQLVSGHDQMPVEVVADVEISVGHPARGGKSVGPSDALASRTVTPRRFSPAIRPPDAYRYLVFWSPVGRVRQQSPRRPPTRSGTRSQKPLTPFSDGRTPSLAFSAGRQPSPSLSIPSGLRAAIRFVEHGGSEAPGTLQKPRE